MPHSSHPFDTSLTSPSLLIRLKQVDQREKSWAEFVSRYGPKISAWCANNGLQDSDSLDVTQVVLVKLLRTMQSFEYDETKSFRAWLKTVTTHAVNDFFRSQNKQRKITVVSGDPGLVEQASDATVSLLEMLSENFERELMDLAMDRVQAKVSKKRWCAFCMLVIENESTTAVAEKTGMQISDIYATRSKIQKMVQQEVRRLESGS